MSDSIKIAKELKSEIDKLPLFQEYYRVKDLVKNDESIKSLKAEITKAKLNKNNKKHKLLLDKYNSHPLVVNYVSLQKEVYEYLKQVSDIVNKK